jgi:hypothetical protein
MMEEKQEKRKFKVGDAMIRTVASLGAITKVGDRVVFRGHYTGDGIPLFHYERNNDSFSINYDHYELEEIMNSPLYQALK